MRLHGGRKFWTGFGAEVLQLFAFFPPLIYLHFICRPAARSSSVVLWRAGGVFSSLTNVLQIARRMSMGEHLNLGHTLLLQFYSEWFHSPVFSFFSAVLPDWFGQIKEELADLFSAWRLCLDPQERAGLSPKPQFRCCCCFYHHQTVLF